MEEVGKGGVDGRQEFDEFLSTFDCILKYLNRKKAIIGKTASVKWSFLRGYLLQCRSGFNRLYELNLICQSRDRGSLLQELKESEASDKI